MYVGKSNESTPNLASSKVLEQSSLSVWFVLAALALLYATLFGRYRAYEIDNPWYLSFSRSFWVDHFSGDMFLNGVFPDGMGGTKVFGKLAALIQGAFLNPFHWQPGPATTLSSTLVLAGLALWYVFLRRCGMNAHRAAAVILTLGLTEPFVGGAERFRYEPLSFLFFAAAFLFANYGRPGLALFVGFLAFEIEPAAILVSTSVLLYLFETAERPRFRRLIVPVTLAVIAFLGAYLALHPQIVQTMHETNWHRGSQQREIGGYLRAYFLSRKRHLPELALLLVAFAVLLRRWAETPPFVRTCARLTGLIGAFSFLLNWPTPAYMIFFYPTALVVAAWSLQRRWPSSVALPTVAAILLLPQYAVLFYLNAHEGFRASDLAHVQQHIALAEHELDLQDDSTRILGDYSLWFAHPAGYQALARTTLGDVAKANLILCFDEPLRPAVMVDPIVRYCHDLPQNLQFSEVDRLSVRGHVLHLVARSRIAASSPAPGPKMGEWSQR